MVHEFLRCRPATAIVLSIALAGCGSSNDDDLALPDWLTQNENASGNATGTGSPVAVPESPTRYDTGPALSAPAAAQRPSVFRVPEGQSIAPPAEPESSPVAAADSSGLPSPEAATAYHYGGASASIELTAGHRLGLVRTIETTLVQTDASQHAHRTKLRVHFTLTIAAVQAHRSRIDVEFDRVELEREVGGVIVSGDTLDPQAGELAIMGAFNAIVGRGFSYWVDPQNQVLAIEGKEALLAEAVARVSPKMRSQVVDAFGSSTNLANLLDETIGLVGRQLATGQTWIASSDHPNEPALVKTYAVVETAPKQATLTVNGTVSPSAIVSGASSIAIEGGRYDGRCVLDPVSGLPISAAATEVIDMTVQLGSGTSVAQRRETVSTLERTEVAAPTVTGSPVADLPPITPVGFEPIGDRDLSRQPSAPAGLVTPEPYFKR